MPDLREDMLPEPSQTEPEVSEDPKTQPDKPSDAQEPASKLPETATPEVPKGYVPYADLKKERERRKELQAQLETLQSGTSEDEDDEPEVTSPDEDIRQEIRELKIDRIVTKHPEIEEMRDDFEEFLEEHSEYELSDAVDLFRVRRGLVGGERPGLEQPTAGPKTPPTSSYTPEEIEDLRKNHYRKYQKLLLAGAFDNVKWGKK